MIAYLKGTVAGVSEDNLVVEVNDIGYNVKIATSTAGRLPGVGERVLIYTYTYVREDTFSLYGFLSRDDMDIFRKLIAVSGIGPKGALAVLSVMSADELRFAVLAGDSRAIAKAPGIGAKTAQRVILDLRDKVSLEDTLVHQNATDGRVLASSDSALPNSGRAKNDAVEALVALGYGAADALKAVGLVELTDEMDSEAILRAALRNLSF